MILQDIESKNKIKSNKLCFSLSPKIISRNISKKYSVSGIEIKSK